MKKFNFKAKDKNGASVTGEVEAMTVNAAAKLVRQKGLVVINISQAREGLFSLIKKIRYRVTTRDITTFTRQLSTMITAGLPITEALSILRLQSQASLQPIVTQILADVEGGSSLSGALSRHPKIFSTTYIALIKAGEAGGVLDSVLARLADNLEKQEEFSGKVTGALIYPAIIVIGMIVVGFVMMIFVIPRLTSLYAEFQAELPLPTRILIGMSTAIGKTWPILAVLVFIAFWGFSAYRQTKAGKRQVDEMIFKIPVFGDLSRQILLTEMTRTLSLMVGAGVSILESLNITAEVMSNAVLSDALRDASKQVEKGFPIAYSFAKHPEAFPYLLSQMVAVGEETGKMEDVLGKVSHVFEVESDQRVKTLTSAVEPLVMVVLGLGVGFLVIAIILPIYNLTSKF